MATREFRVTVTDRVYLITGPVSIAELGVLTGLAPNGVLSPRLAEITSCNIAFGSLEDVQKLIAEYEPIYIQSVRDRHKGLNTPGVEWLASGERGISSNTIYSYLTGIDAMNGNQYSYPSDFYDFRRCRLVLEAVEGLKEKFSDMAKVSPEWDVLVAAWPKLCESMDTLVPTWRSQECFEKKSPYLDGINEVYKMLRAALKTAPSYK